MKQGEKISNLENASQNLIHIPLTICKRFLKKSFQNIKYEERIHAYLMKCNIGLIPSNLCTYLLQTSSITALIYLLWFVLASITKKGEIEREIGSNLFLNDFGG